MAARATISNNYRWRLALIALMCLGWGLYSVYDGVVGYPDHNKNVEAWNAVMAVPKASGAEPTTQKSQSDREDDWKKVAKEHHWSEENPGTMHSASDIYVQFIMAALTLPIGLFYLVSFLGSYSRWVATDETGVSSSKGLHAPYEAITTLDKTLWRTKGIAHVKYTDAGRAEKRIILDNWKYEEKPTDAMVAEIESRLQPEQITGNIPSESPLPPPTA